MGMNAETKAIIAATAKATADEVMKHIAEGHIAEIATQAAEQAVKDIFSRFGFDPNNPRETASLIAWAHGTKEVSGAVKKTVITTFFTLMASGIGYAVWQAIKGGGTQ